MNPDERFEVFDESAEIALKQIGDLLTAGVPEGYIFSFIMASVGDGGNTFYISNGNRDDMIATMKEMIQKLETKNDDTPKAP